MRNFLKSLLFPPFLERLDEKLLLNRPWLWATRLHRVAWPALVLAIVAAVAGAFVPVTEPFKLQQYIGFGVMGIVITQIALVIYWLYGQDAYHVEREHGADRDRNGWREFGTYTAALSMVAVSLFLFISVGQMRTRTLDKQMLARDLFLLHLVTNIEHRDDYLHNVVNEYMPSYEWDNGEPPTREQELANEARHNEYNRLNSLRSTYETRLDRAASLFEEGGKEQLLRRYFLQKRGQESIQQAQYWVNPSWDQDGFVAEHLRMSDLVPLQAMWAQGDYTLLFDLMAQYERIPADTLPTLWADWAAYDITYVSERATSDYYRTSNPHRSEFDRFEWSANNNARNLFDFGFELPKLFALAFWAIVAAIAIHLGLLRFTFKHSGLKGFLVMIGGVVALFIGFVFYMFFGQMIDYRLDRHIPDLWRWYTAGGLTIGLTIVLIALLKTRGIARQLRFSWPTAMALYLLPLLLIATPYLLLGMEELLTDWIGHYSWFSKHFLDSNPHLYHLNTNVKTWSYAPLGFYILYFVQFAYLPLIGWLKQKHTRLMSLPR